MTMPDSLVGAAAATDQNPKKILFGKYELGRLLGCGAFAKVYHARTLPGSNNSTSSSFSSSSVAIKIINKSRLARPGLARSNIRREVAILRRVRHQHIVRLVEVLASRTKIFFVLEFVKGGELFARLSKTGRLSEELSRRLFRQLISAVGYCHSRGVFHRDLKPENLLLDEHNNLKVSDFGLSALSADDASGPPSQQEVLLHTLCGTPAYVAPEILSKKGYDGAKVDVWSCGVILFVLNAGYLPFNDSNLMNMYKKIYRGEYRIPKWTSPELRRLLSGILDTNPDTRMSVDDISRDPWFRKGMGDEDWEAMMGYHELEKDEQLEEEEVDHNRELNAFDLISFSSGVNLSGLFEPGVPTKERFVSREPGEGILGTAEEVGREEGLYVRRRRGKRGGGVVVEGHNGDFGVGVRVYRLNQEMVVVEVEVGGETWAKELWREKMAPAIKKPITIT
ncbi:CBL-interacting serine/threonine-protein kinase 14-like [Iris pallida]|uniref:non-specific serine/threonine protein kinase n=1 Tax=Iris pallida TaxID=29817 RepID=A0AAX6IFR9_IRIPA|nr:CBL-interacting serine/threonine-protein kinase 14-like [Iris pallida]